MYTSKYNFKKLLNVRIKHLKLVQSRNGSVDIPP